MHWREDLLIRNILLLLCSIWLQPNIGLCYQHLEYGMPVKHKIELSGNFCELRSNHYHAGIDIRSAKGVVGDSLFSVADGKLSRVRVQRGSYGQVLYIDHPNGTTSVYAHLDQFHPKIAKLIRDYQVRVEESEVDIYLDSTAVSIKKGDFIGLMGNTGRSSGPHLHFEIRDTDTEEALNPLQFGYSVKDNTLPVVKSLWYHELDSLGKITTRNQIKLKKTADGEFTALEPIRPYSGAIGFAIDVADQGDGSRSKNGLQIIELSVDTVLWSKISMNKVNFEEQRDINCLIDYRYYKQSKSRIMRLYGMQNRVPSILKTHPKSIRGIVELNKAKPKEIRIRAIDNSGNSVVIYIPVDVTKIDDTKLSSKKYRENQTLFKDGIKLSIPATALYESEELKLGKQGNSCSIGSQDIPLHEYISVCITDSTLQHKAVLIKQGTSKSFGGEIQKDKLYTSIDELGNFEIVYDLEAPTIETIRFDKNRKRYPSWKFRVKDNLSDEAETSQLYIQVYTTYGYIPSFYDLKSNLLEIHNLNLIPEQSPELVIESIDIAGNRVRKIFSLK
jgi:hypothetical protein